MTTRLNWLRQRRLGLSGSLTLFKKNSATQYGALVANADSGFFIGRERDVDTGELEVFLTIDETSTLTQAAIKLAIGCDVCDGSRTTRYKIKNKTPPTDGSRRWVLTLIANQTDTTAIV